MHTQQLKRPAYEEIRRDNSNLPGFSALLVVLSGYADAAHVRALARMSRWPGDCAVVPQVA